jgi:hypothetical protein
MNKEFIPYEEALALKELGFNENCLCFYNHNGQLVRYMNPDKDWNSLQSQIIRNSKITLPDTYSAPTYSQAFRWFRDKHNLSGFTLPWGEGLFDYRIYSTKEGLHLFSSPEYSSTEEAELACLKELIEIVKNK